MERAVKFDSFVGDIPKDDSRLEELRDIGNGYKMRISSLPVHIWKIEFLFYGKEPHSKKNDREVAVIYFRQIKTFYYTNLMQLNGISREAFFDYLKAGHPKLLEYLLWHQ